MMKRLEDGESSTDLRSRRMSYLDGLWHEYKVEEARWRQKAKILWIKSEDRNTVYFHATCKVRQSARRIKKLVVNEEITEDPILIKETIFQYFKSFFSHEDICRPKIKCSNMYRLKVSEREALEAKFSEA